MVYTFTYNNYLVQENENTRAYFHVTEKTASHLNVMIYQEDKQTFEIKRFEESLEIKLDANKQEEYVEVLGHVIYASQYYNPNVSCLIAV